MLDVMRLNMVRLRLIACDAPFQEDGGVSLQRLIRGGHFRRFASRAQNGFVARKICVVALHRQHMKTPAGRTGRRRIVGLLDLNHAQNDCADKSDCGIRGDNT
jgi:hypothetical protein